jgi:hypothetical protein
MKRSLIARPLLLAAVVVSLVALVGGIALNQEGSPVPMAGANEYCFAEWCIAPRAASIGLLAIVVNVRVRSDAQHVSQRPDHPQAWVIDASGRQIGGPQHTLDGIVGPGDTYTAALTFDTSHPGTCPALLVSEGAWPPFLGLGYAASPFTTRVQWRLCDIAG